MCACIGLCGLVDLCVARHFGPGRYFALHVAVNLVTSPFALRDFATTFTNPTPFAMASCANAGTPCAAKLTVDLAMGIHLWHGLAYSLKPIDWVHHIPAHVVCLIGLFFPTVTAIRLNLRQRCLFLSATSLTRACECSALAAARAR